MKKICNFSFTILFLIGIIMASGCGMTAEDWAVLNASLGQIANDFNEDMAAQNQSMAGFTQSIMNQVNQNNTSLRNYNRSSSLYIPSTSNSRVYTPSPSNYKSIYDGYMEGHPANNSTYYEQQYDKNRGHPSLDPDYYNKQYNYNGVYQSQ